jgi:hypothetical protein
MMMRVSFGTPPGCKCHPEVYSNGYTWALYEAQEGGEGEKFIISGRKFSTWSEAFEAGRAFCETLPGQASQENIDQN